MGVIVSSEDRQTDGRGHCRKWKKNFFRAYLRER